METKKRYAVFSIRKKENAPSVWVRAGSAFVNRDGSMNLYLDVLPIDGQLHVREPGEKREQAPVNTGFDNPVAEAAAAGGH
ncbi:MAG: hypothetical protein ACOZIN_10305 [Myxococcota bacterium]